MWAALVWIGKVCVAVLKWAAAHWVLALAVGAGALILGDYLREQNWFGADTLASWVEGAGWTIAFWAFLGALLPTATAAILGASSSILEVLTPGAPWNPYTWFGYMPLRPSSGVY